MCSLAACACSKREKSRNEVVGVVGALFQICAILKRHKSIQHEERAKRHFETSQEYVCVTIVSIMHIAFGPSAFRNIWISASSWFPAWFNLGSFLLPLHKKFLGCEKSTPHNSVKEKKRIKMLYGNQYRCLRPQDDAL